jgi:hypothetical protein
MIIGIRVVSTALKKMSERLSPIGNAFSLLTDGEGNPLN